jgi:pectate lyase
MVYFAFHHQTFKYNRSVRAKCLFYFLIIFCLYLGPSPLPAQAANVSTLPGARVAAKREWLPLMVQKVPFPVFPGAEGFGSKGVGGRGGRVFEVTNLNDSGAGSLRECVEANGPRVCVFRVAGTITLHSDLEIENPYITIAGQTAPGGGITLRAADSTSSVHLQVEASEVVIRYLRSRPGTRTENARALSINNGATGADAVHNVVIDHNSFSWSGDELTITWAHTNNVTLQWNIMAESLPDAPGSGSVGLKGPSLGETGGGFFSFHHNLIAHHTQRLPQISASVGPVDVVNNLIYNPGGLGSTVKNGARVNFIGNYVKSGPNTRITTYVKEEGAAGYYTEENVLEGTIQSFLPPTNKISPAPFNAPPVTTTSAQMAYDQVLQTSGAAYGVNCEGFWFPRRDPVDIRIVQSVVDSSRGHPIPPELTFQQLGFISDPADVGGWPLLDPGTPCADSDHDGMPDIWEIAHFGDTSRGSATDSSSDLDSDGYSDLEEYLNGTDPNEMDIAFNAQPGPTLAPTSTPEPSTTPLPTSSPQPTLSNTETSTAELPSPSPSVSSPTSTAEVMTPEVACPDCPSQSPPLLAARYCDAAGDLVNAPDEDNPRLYIGIGCVPIGPLLNKFEDILPWFVAIGGGILLVLIVYVGFLMKSLKS